MLNLCVIKPPLTIPCESRLFLSWSQWHLMQHVTMHDQITLNLQMCVRLRTKPYCTLVIHDLALVDVLHNVLTMCAYIYCPPSHAKIINHPWQPFQICRYTLPNLITHIVENDKLHLVPMLPWIHTLRTRCQQLSPILSKKTCNACSIV